MLGSRYGFVPSTYAVEQLPEFDWLRGYPTGRSVTELEFAYGALDSITHARAPVRLFLILLFCNLGKLKLYSGACGHMSA